MPQDIYLNDQAIHQKPSTSILVLLGAAFVAVVALTSVSNNYTGVTPNASSVGIEDWHGNVRRSQ